MEKLALYYHLARPAAVLRATGPDAFAFLQSQFSNDLNCPEVEKPVTYGLWLDHKGKIQADSFILQQTKDHFLLVSYDSPVASLLAHLAAHLIADVVELRDETADFGLLHVWTDQPPDAIAEMVEKMAEAAKGECWVGHRPRAGSWELLAAPMALEAVAESLAGHGGTQVDAEELHAERIMAGVPSVPVDAGPGDLPQEAGLDQGAVAYNKGCYLGQEVMMRLHTQGHANRGLWQIGWEDAPELAGGQQVLLFAGNKPAGELRSRVIKGRRGLGLAMLKKRAIGGLRTLRFSPDGPQVVSLVKEIIH